eukprot:6192453-Pleurochrysis_carterae.AAC.4
MLAEEIGMLAKPVDSDDDLKNIAIIATGSEARTPPAPARARFSPSCPRVLLFGNEGGRLRQRNGWRGGSGHLAPRDCCPDGRARFARRRASHPVRAQASLSLLSVAALSHSFAFALTLLWHPCL